MNGDPIGSDEPRGKDCSKRMGRYDGSFTPTEQKMKDQLMKQFTRFGEGVGGNTAAYRDGWERTFERKPKEPVATTKDDIEHEAWMNELADRLIFKRPDKFKSNYDCIDWSK
jgi:hypothetical protein